MMFSNRDPDRESHAIRITRDVVEIVAILAAGFWAFYVFIYENRIKPSFTDPQVAVSATLQKTSQHAGADGILLKTELRNVGVVPFYLVGYAVTVLGARVTLSTHPMPPTRSSRSETTDTYFRQSKFVPVYGSGYITSLGNPSSTRELELQPGGNGVQESIFFVPAGRFDFLTVHLNACFSKYAGRTVPARLEFHSDGVAVVTCSAEHLAYDVGTLDLQK